MKKDIIAEGWVSIDNKGYIDRGNLGIPYFWKGRRNPKNKKGVVKVVLVPRDEYLRLKKLEKELS